MSRRLNVRTKVRGVSRTPITGRTPSRIIVSGKFPEYKKYLEK